MALNPADYTTGFQTGRGRKIDPKKSPLAHLMVNRGWTAEALSRATGINYDTLLRYIRATLRINPQHLAMLGEALGVEPKFFDLIPPERPEIDWDLEIQKVFDRIMRGEHPQYVLDTTPVVPGGKKVLKSVIRLFVRIKKGELVGVFHSTLAPGD